MDDKILKLLDSQNIDAAKFAIIDYEDKIKEEKSEYTRCRMIDRLNLYKKIFSSKVRHKVVDIQEKSACDLKFVGGVTSSSKLHICDRQANFAFESSFGHSFFSDKFKITSMPGLMYSEACIVNSSQIIVGYFEAEQTVYINRVADATIICKANQIRLKDSHNVSLYVDVTGGISLERCSKIKICGLKSPDNKYREIKDFTNPFESDNYEFITHEWH